jgi:probable F420-dependent oxidoreductase
MDRRIGVTLPLPGQWLRESVDVARSMEDAGFTDIWTAEVAGTDAFAVCSAIGAATSKARIGVAIVPVFTRPPALIAMGAATAQQASGGRFNLGLGASTPTIVENWMGERFEHPVARMRETMDFVRRALAGEKLSYEGKTITTKGFRLDTAGGEVPIFLAALGPRMMELARESADGVALFAVSTAGVKLARESVPDKELIARLVWAPGASREEARGLASWILPPYVSAPGYNPWVARQGFEAEAEAINKAWNSGDREGARTAVTERLADALVLSGGPEEVADRLEEFYEAGLSTPILMPTSSDPDALMAVAKRVTG